MAARMKIRLAVALCFAFFALSLFAQTPCTTPAAPTLTAPATAVSGQYYEVSWNATAAAEYSYELQESKNPDLTGAVTYTPVNVLTVHAVHYLTTPATYYYRVRVNVTCDGSTLTSPWSATRAVAVSVPDSCVLGPQWARTGATWHAGAQVAIKWFRHGACGSNVKIELLEKNNFSVSWVLFESTPNDGAELWTIPANQARGPYYIKLTDLTTGQAIYDSFPIFAQNTGPRPPRAEFNGDGRHDLLWRNKDTGQLWASTVKDGAVFGGFALQGNPNAAWRVVGTGDFNAYGVSDYLRRNASTGEVAIQLLSGCEAEWCSRVIWTESNPAWQILDLADFDGDRYTDILWRNSSTGQVYIQLVTHYYIKAYNVVWKEPNLSWQIVAATDLNGDGKADLLWRNMTTGAVYIMYMNGLLVQSRGYFSESRTMDWTLAAAGDIDGDGDSDLIWRHNANGQVWATIVNGLQAASSTHIWTEANANWRIEGMGDFDSNGKHDLLWRNSTTGVVYLVRLNGPSVIAHGVLYTEPKLSWEIVSP
jgi:hypothetical protein